MSMNNTMRLVCGLLAAVLCSASTASGADDFTKRAREVFEKHKDAVVTVQIVLRSKVTISGNDQSNEARQEITGTVIDPSGLVVLSLSVTDPGSFMRRMLSEENQRFKLETELSDIKILLPDGGEVPAEVVLRDADLDLAFLRPKSKPASPMIALDLSNAGKAEVLDEVISVNRMGRAAGRVHAASLERISAIMQRPRLLYIPMGGMTTTALGCPAFTSDGKVLGIFVVRGIREAGTGGMGGSQSGNVTATIIPAADVLKISKQAPEAGAAVSSSGSQSGSTNAPSSDNSNSTSDKQ